MKKVISILRDHYRSMPFLDFILFIWHSLFKNERILVYCISIQESDAIYKKNSNLPIVKGDLGDLDHERKYLEQPPWEFQCDRYDGVRDFFVYKENGIIGHISWLYYKKDPNRLLCLGQEDCEIKFCLTLPEFRGKGLYPSALETILKYLKENKYQRCFICVKHDNLPSIRGIEKSGFQQVGQIYFQKALGLQISPKLNINRLRIT